VLYGGELKEGVFDGPFHSIIVILRLGDSDLDNRKQPSFQLAVRPWRYLDHRKQKGTRLVDKRNIKSALRDSGSQFHGII
jgi:hypothetical protein